ncbi:MAG: HNH endonuclease [Gemmatimonadota bacterium]
MTARCSVAAEDGGEVSNGLALCTLHHRAFDRELIGITPELRVHVFRERLEHADEKPTAILTDFHGRPVSTPRNPAHHPDRGLVADRWEAARSR